MDREFRRYVIIKVPKLRFFNMNFGFRYPLDRFIYKEF
jgi:hypothetical protein